MLHSLSKAGASFNDEKTNRIALKMRNPIRNSLFPIGKSEMSRGGRLLRWGKAKSQHGNHFSLAEMRIPDRAHRDLHRNLFIPQPTRAFGVDDDDNSHLQFVARAKPCSRCRSLFLSVNGSFFVVAEEYRPYKYHSFCFVTNVGCKL